MIFFRNKKLTFFHVLILIVQKITTPNKLNATALHGAAAVGSADVVELLLSKGLHMHKNVLNKDNQTALEVAISRANYSEDVKKVLPQLKALLTGEGNNDDKPNGDDADDVIEISEDSGMDDTENSDL